MSSRVSRFSFLRDTQVSSLAAVRAHPLGQSLAGLTRVVVELVSGASGAAGEPPASGKNPQGLVGVDLSGPPWGPALRHPVAAFSGAQPTSSISQPPSPFRPVHGGAGEERWWTSTPWIFHVRQHEIVPGVDVPYSRGRIAVRARRTGVSSTTLRVRWRNLSVDDTYRSADITLSSTTDANFLLPTGDYLSLLPGLNSVQLSFAVLTSGEGAEVSSVSVYAAAKLSH